MGNLKIINNIINQRGTPAFNSNTIANRPAAGYVGRIFISTDTFVIQRDNGTGWDSLGGGGGGITGSGAAGQATFWTGASAVSGDNAFFWDNTNKRLGINTATPGVRLDIHGTGVLQQLNGTTTNDAFLDFQNAGTSRWRVGNNYNGGTPLFSLQNRTSNLYPVQFQNDGSVMFGSTNFTNLAFIPYWYTFIREGGIATMNILSAVSGGNNGSVLYFTTTRGTNKADYAATQSGDRLMNINANGTNGTTYVSSSGITIFQSAASTVSFAPADMEFNIATSAAINVQLKLFQSGYNTFLNRLNVNNATDNSLFELNVNGNTYTGGLSPTILTVGTNTTMARTATGYYCTATLTLTLPSAASINNVYWVIAASGVTVTVNRAGTDDILNLAGTSVTSITITSNQRAMFYVGGGTRTFLISQA